MTQFSSPSDQAVCGQGYIAHGHDQPPCQDGAADHTAQNEVEGKQGNPSTQGAAAQRLSEKIIQVHAAAVVPVPLERSAVHLHFV